VGNFQVLCERKPQHVGKSVRVSPHPHTGILLCLNLSGVRFHFKNYFVGRGCFGFAGQGRLSRGTGKVSSCSKSCFREAMFIFGVVDLELRILFFCCAQSLRMMVGMG
jgi:hypothetical protein